MSISRHSASVSLLSVVSYTVCLPLQMVEKDIRKDPGIHDEDIISCA